MARPLRIEYPGAVYHVTSRGNAGNNIFSDEEDRKQFLSILGAVVKRYHWFCHAYCLMDNHYHILIETPDANLSMGMRQLNGIYTQKYNKRHCKTGHLFQGRFKVLLVQKDQYLLELCRYVVLNPLRAGLVRKLQDWKWSSYPATVGLERAEAYLTTDWILSLFNTQRRLAQRKYQKFVQEGINCRSPWEKIQGQVLLGEEGFIDKIKEFLENKKEVKEIPRLQRYANRPSLDRIFKREEGKVRRDECIVTAQRHYGYTLKEIADHLGIHYTTISKVITKADAKNEK